MTDSGYSDKSDNDLMRAMAEKDGDGDALREIYRRYGRAVYSWIYKTVRDKMKAEDLTQEVFVRAWRRAETFDSTRGNASTWLFGIARNCTYDLLRKKSDIVGLPDTEPGYTETRDLEAIWIGGQIAAALDVLPNEQRQVLDLAYRGQLSQREISERLGIPLGTVKSRTFAALKRLREILSIRGLMPEPAGKE